MSLLDGIRVLDLSLQLPGPFCTMLMADHGAEVIKVDEPVPRLRNPFSAGEPGTSPAERYLNRGKKSLTLNLKTDEGREIFRALADTADVVVEGFRPGVMTRLGADYAALSARNPRLVFCSISGYGQTGPLAAAAGHDINYISYAGVLGLNGEAGGGPSPPPVQIGDLFGGALMALSGILMALLSRERTGRGRHLDIAMTDGALSMLSIHAAEALAGGPEPQRGRMTLTGAIPCYGVYRCADGKHVSIGPLEGWFWERMIAVLGRNDLKDGPYATGAAGEKVRGELAAIFATRGRDAWVDLFASHDVCVSPVLALGEALSHPNTRGRGMVVPVESPLGGREEQLGDPIKVVGEDPPAPSRAPRLGEHDEAILRGLGCADDRIRALREMGVIRKA